MVNRFYPTTDTINNTANLPQGQDKDFEGDIVRSIINARKQAGLTQKELADRTGISQGDISKLESGYSNPSMRTLQRLAKGMGKKIKLVFM